MSCARVLEGVCALSTGNRILICEGFADLRAAQQAGFLFSIALVLVEPIAAQLRALSPPLIEAPQPANSSYVQPSQQQKLHNYLFEAFGPYPVAWTTIVAGYHQAKRNPPDWREGMAGFGERYASDFGNSVVNNTTRYAVAAALHEDTMYYRCACSGVWPRVAHAVYWSAFVHRDADGHAAVGVPVLVAPYAANMTAVYGWYPRRYRAKDAFRMGNYGLLSYVIGNISLEFLSPVLHAKRSSFLTRMHFDNRHLAPEPQP